MFLQKWELNEKYLLQHIGALDYCLHPAAQPCILKRGYLLTKRALFADKKGVIRYFRI